MGMAGSESWMSVQDVAQALGVSAPRVRQLVQERKLPEPTKFGDRASLWSRADVEALRFTQDGKGVVTERTSLMPTPTEPLRRIVDDVHIPEATRWSGNFQIHVRIFQGVVEGVNRTVVILSQLPSGGSLTNSFESVANEITARFLDDNVHAVTWIQTNFGDSHATYAYEVQNVTMRLDHSEAPLPGPESWFDRITAFGRTPSSQPRQAAGYQSPDWHPCSIEEVHRILGHSIEWYPKEGYTLREIEHWQRNGRPRTVEIDPLGLKPVVDALEAMTAIPRSHPFSKAARMACFILANIAMVKDEEDERLMPAGTAEAFIQEREDYYTSAGITESAAKLVPYRLVGDDSSLVNRHATSPLTLPWELDIRETTDLYLELRRWAEETDRWATGHNEDLHGHIETVLGWLRFPTLQEELKERRDVYPYGLVRTFAHAGDWDRAYVESINFDTNIDSSNRVYRMLQAETSLHPETQYGYDPFGNMVACTNSQAHPSISVYWPSKPQPMPLDAQIVADGMVGDRPAYIAKEGRIIGLLAQFPAFHHNGWNFGYGGGGPGRLAADIVEAIMWQEDLPKERMPRRWVDDAVCHSDKDLLTVNVADIMRRLDTEKRQ
jgi:predicted DNA-binding transcriptional regulator AlpA